ncbi:MAG TPA: CHRD domain-containing protein [Candidatus Baltobacteraceae bacterium]|nr:CHRD domain-containing protein [Candidatus Baltobacteraceae bacterium]
MVKIGQRVVTAVGCILFFTLIASAQGTKFEAKLSGKNQNPAIETPAHGTATFELSADGKSLSYKLDVVDIDNVSMAHIHMGPAGEEGPVVAWLYPSKPPAVVKKGKFTGVLARGTLTEASLAGPLKGKTMADLVDQIKAGKAYVNVHTEKYPAGEIRGQIE